MKKLIFVLSFVFALLLMFACNEEQAVDKKVGTNYPFPHYTQKITLQCLVDSIGYYHNDDVDYLRENLDSTWDSSIESDYYHIMNMSHNYIVTKTGTYQFDSTYTFSSYSAWNTLDFRIPCQQLYIQCKNSNAWDSIYCIQETIIIDSLMNYIVNFVSTGNDESDYQLLYNFTNNLNNQWNEINWDSIENNTAFNFPGTFFHSFLNLTLKSIEYAHINYQNMNRKNPDIQVSLGPGLAFAALCDASGFEYGYCMAVYNDIASGWITDPKRTLEEIEDRFWYYTQQGLQTAGTWSSFAMNKL